MTNAKAKADDPIDPDRWDLWAMRGYTDTPSDPQKEADLAMKIFLQNSPEDSFSRMCVSTGTALMVNESGIGMEAYKKAAATLDLNEGVSSIANTSSVITTTPTVVNIHRACKNMFAARVQNLVPLMAGRSMNELESLLGPEMFRYLPPAEVDM